MAGPPSCRSWLPGTQTRLVVRQVLGNELCIQPVSLAALAKSLAIVVHVHGIEHVHMVPPGMSKGGKLEAVAASGLQGNDGIARQAREPQLNRICRVGNALDAGLSVHSDDEAVFGYIHTYQGAGRGIGQQAGRLWHGALLVLRTVHSGQFKSAGALGLALTLTCVQIGVGLLGLALGSRSVPYRRWALGLEISREVGPFGRCTAASLCPSTLNIQALQRSPAGPAAVKPRAPCAAAARGHRKIP